MVVHQPSMLPRMLLELNQTLVLEQTLHYAGRAWSSSDRNVEMRFNNNSGNQHLHLVAH